MKDRNINFIDIADQEIISKSTDLGLDDYIPFHSHPYSSFDVAVKSTYSNEAMTRIDDGNRIVHQVCLL